LAFLNTSTGKYMKANSKAASETELEVTETIKIKSYARVIGKQIILSKRFIELHKTDSSTLTIQKLILFFYWLVFVRLNFKMNLAIVY